MEALLAAAVPYLRGTPGRHLRAFYGVPPEQAETHAEAARQFIMADIATRDDLLELQTLRLSVRFGLMLAAGLSLMTALLGLLIRFH
jgi:hypothetical protein